MCRPRTLKRVQNFAMLNCEWKAVSSTLVLLLYRHVPPARLHDPWAFNSYSIVLKVQLRAREQHNMHSAQWVRDGGLNRGRRRRTEAWS